MGDLQATVEFLVELHKFYNVDLFIRGYYQFRLTFKPPKSSHAIQAEVYEGHGTGGAFSLFPAYVTDDGQTAVSRTFNIYYKDEEVLLKDVFLFRVHLLVDSTKAADCIDKAALEMTVDVHFTDQVIRQNNYQNLPLVTSRTLKFHFSCFNGLHHQIPLLFDYYYFSVLDMIVHANVVSLGLPNWGVLKQIKTGWFSKSSTTPRSSTPLFFTTLFGNRSQLGVQFYSDVSLRYAVTNSNSISRENFQKASAVHRNLCAILAMAHAQLLKYFDEMMQYLDAKQRIKLAEKLDPADLVEGLCKKLETLQSCEEVFDEICSDMSVLNNELALLWLQFQESFALSDQIRPLLRKQHHHERMMHFSEAFFVHELPWKSLLNVTDSSFQKHMNMGQCVKNSRYLSIIPAVTIECAEVDGDNNTTPIFFEDRYVNKKGQSLENVCAIPVHGGIEDDVLEHKPLCFGILNQAFNDLTPQGDLDTKDVWVDIKTSEENDVIAARVAHAGQDTMGDECKVTEKTESCEEGIDISAISPENKADINSATATTQASHGKVDVSTESTDGTTPKTLLKCSMETLQEANDTCKDKSTVQDSQEHCGSMQGTTGREDSDVNNIAGLDTTADEEAMKSKMVSVIEPSTSDGQPASIYDSTIATGSQESRTVSEGDGASRGNHEDCSRASKDQVQTIDTKSLDNVLEPKVCLTPDNKSQATVLENDNSLESSNGKEVLGLGEVDSSNFLDSKSGKHVRYSSGEGTVKKTSSVQYVGCSDTVNSSDVAAETKPRTSSKIGQSEPVTVAGVEKVSKDGEADRTQSTGISTGKDEANSTSEFCNSPDATICHINNTEIGDSSAKSSLGTDVTNSSNAPLTDNSFKSGDFTRSAKDNLNRGSKVRNTAQINPGKRVSNSIFYENISFGEDGNKQNEDTPSTRLDTVRLTPNSSTDVIGCFCGGKLAGASSPYRLTSETDASNIMLAKAKQDVLSQMNYCGVLYSDTTTEFLVQPYFMNTKPDLSMEPVHFVVCVHGLDGNSGDLRLLRCFLEMALPSTKFEFLMSEVNQDNTFSTFEKQTDKLVSEILHHLEAYRISPTRISFIGHSLGNIIIRSALNHPSLEPYVELFHTLLSLSGPHLGMVHHTSSLVSTGMWLLQKWKKSDSLLQLSLNDSPDMRETFIYKLSKKKGLEYFTNVLLVSSVQDHYAPFHSSRIELPKSLRSNSQEYIVYREMMENLLTPLLSQPNRSLVRYSVYHCLPSSTNTFIGRAAHIAMLDSELFIEKLICTSAAKYFQ